MRLSLRLLPPKEKGHHMKKTISVAMLTLFAGILLMAAAPIHKNGPAPMPGKCGMPGNPRCTV
jgi:hypothetical protein